MCYGHVCRGDTGRGNAHPPKNDQVTQKQAVRDKGAQRGKKLIQQWQSKYPAPAGQTETIKLPPPWWIQPVTHL